MRPCAKIIGIQVHHSVFLHDAMRGAINACAGVNSARVRRPEDPELERLEHKTRQLAARSARPKTRRPSACGPSRRVSSSAAATARRRTRTSRRPSLTRRKLHKRPLIAAVAAALLVIVASAGAQLPPDTQDLAPGETPLHRVKVHAFKAIDESGPHWAGPDEMFVLRFKSRLWG